MTINYLEPVNTGTLITESRVLHDAGPIVTLQSRISDPGGRLVAVVQGTRYISRAAKRRVTGAERLAESDDGKIDAV